MEFHANIPSWIIKYISEKKCKHCDCKVSKKDIIAFGIRKVDLNSSKDMTTFFVENKCPKCSYRALTTFDHDKQATIQEMSYILLEHISNRKKIQNSKNTEGINKHTEMTDLEIKNFIDNLNNQNTYLDFLKEIGAMSYHNMLENDKSDEK